MVLPLTQVVVLLDLGTKSECAQRPKGSSKSSHNHVLDPTQRHFPYMPSFMPAQPRLHMESLHKAVLETRYHSGMCMYINHVMFPVLTAGGSGLLTIRPSLVASLSVWSVTATHGLLIYSWAFSVSLRNCFPPGTFIGLLLNLFKTLIFYLQKFNSCLQRISVSIYHRALRAKACHYF